MIPALTNLEIYNAKAVEVRRSAFRNGPAGDFDIVYLQVNNGVGISLFTTPGGLANLAPLATAASVEEAA